MSIPKLIMTLVALLAILSACSAPVTRTDSTASVVVPEQQATLTQQPNQVVEAPVTIPSAEPLPVPPTRTYTLNAAATALVGQAHAQLSSKNFMMAASTIERAMRIEPNNPLLWIEYSQIRMSEGNYSQAETMARKALMLANGDPHAQSMALHTLAGSLRAQDKNNQAQQADARADALMPK